MTLNKTFYPSKETKELLEALLKLKNPNESKKFLRDLLTIKEIDDISKRFQIAKDLYLKKGSYEKIAKKYSVSTSTVTRVAYWLNHGMEGYKLILSRMLPNKK